MASHLQQSINVSLISWNSETLLFCRVLSFRLIHQHSVLVRQVNTKFSPNKNSNIKQLFCSHFLVICLCLKNVILPELLRTYLTYSGSRLMNTVSQKCIDLIVPLRPRYISEFFPTYTFLGKSLKSYKTIKHSKHWPHSNPCKHYYFFS